MNDLVRGGLIAAVLSLVFNVIIFLVGSSQGISWAVSNGLSPTVTLMPVILLTLVATVAAVILFAILQRMSDRPIEIFLWIALIIGLLSLIPVYTGTSSRSTLIALGLMHVGAALGITWGLLYAMRHTIGDEA